MQLRTHAQILKNAKWFILLFTLVVGAAAWMFTVLAPQSYKAVTSFELTLVNRQQSPDYQYGAYYDLKAAELYTQHLMSLMMTPAVVQDVYETAGIGYEIDSIPRFTNRFRTKQYSAQNFVVEFSEYNPETAEKLSQAIATVIEKRSKETGSINGDRVFAVTAAQPVIAPNVYSPVFIIVVGVLVGLLSSVILVYLREYFR